MVDLEKTYPRAQALLWKGLPYVQKENLNQSNDKKVPASQ
jgi:hypothetical protein